MSVAKKDLGFEEFTRKVEDYLEAIYVVSDESGYAGTTDIAKELGIKPPSVTEMLARLRDSELVQYAPYKGAKLTEHGLEIAKSVKSKHDIFRRLLSEIGVPDKIAKIDACTLEHNLDPKTINCFAEFVEFIETSLYPKWKKDYEDFRKK
ncbi:TPA: metal-dependent transcriptional regulator [Candidatus Micrarchaeota archaeon]|nr:metal-dependent transcriptional regulator [Candidatus Micrarchaeota archaeon]